MRFLAICVRGQKFSRANKIISRFVSSIRNVGIVAHIDAGKTTTSEQMLYLCGETKVVGRVDSGNTIMDFLPQERERGITISAAAISMNWKGNRINLIDTPGHVDFTIEVERSVRVLDGSILIVDGVSGVQAQTKTVWRQVKKQQTPAIAFVNKMDRDGASFDRTIKSLKSKLGANAVPIQYPIGSEETFEGVIDLISLRKIIWPKTTNKNPEAPTIKPLETNDILYDVCMQRRKQLLESISEYDEQFMEKYLESEDSISITDILNALRKICLDGHIIPTLCGASLRGKGVEPLLDSIIAFLPSPDDKLAIRAINHKTGDIKLLSPKSTQELCAFAFKVVHDATRGPLVYARIFSGHLTNKSILYNTNRNQRERVNQLLSVSADDLDMLSEASSGSVCCIVGLKNTGTGDTLVIDKSPLQSFVLDGLQVPKPVYSLAIEPEKSSQQTALEEALTILCTEDPSLIVELDKESGQTLIRGIGELHLEIVCDKLKRQFNIDVCTGKAYVAYRETVNSNVTQTFTYNRTLGQKRMFAELSFEVTNNDNTEEPTFTIDKELKHSLASDEYNALCDGIKGAFSRGPKGYPIVGLSVKVVNLVKDLDTTAGSIRACAAMFIDHILRNEDYHQFLEPIMYMEVELPERYVGDILSDLTSQRRAEIKEIIVNDANRHTIQAFVPLATILGYATTLRSKTQGEGMFTLEYHKHEPVDYSMAKSDMK